MSCFCMKAFKPKALAMLLLLCACISLHGADASNHIKFGESRITIDGDLPEGAIAVVYVGSVFDMPVESTAYNFKADSGTLNAQVPLDTERAIGILRIMAADGMPYAIGMIELSQTKPLVITAAKNDDGSLTFRKSNADGVNSFSIGRDEGNLSMPVGMAMQNLISLESGKRVINDFGLTAEDFNSPELFGAKVDSLLHFVISNSLSGIEMPKEVSPWLGNNMMAGSIAMWPMNFKNLSAMHGNGATPSASLPMEYFKFLNAIDFSPTILTYYPDLPPYSLFRHIINDIPGIEPIGDMSVDEWKSRTRSVLEQAIDNQPLDLVLDLLSASSYISQFNDENRPLSPKQIENVKSGYAGDLGKIILSRNDRLEHQLAVSTNVYDMADKGFDLKAFLDEHYPGKAVVADFWNTWCGPCRQAHKETAPLRNLPECEGVVFVYIADDTSNLDEWKSLASRIGGEHVWISKEGQAVGAFPTYMFFDKEHNLSATHTSFRGADAYLDAVRQINK